MSHVVAPCRRQGMPRDCTWVAIRGFARGVAEISACILRIKDNLVSFTTIIRDPSRSYRRGGLRSRRCLAAGGVRRGALVGGHQLLLQVQLRPGRGLLYLSDPRKLQPHDFDPRRQLPMRPLSLWATAKETGPQGAAYGWGKRGLDVVSWRALTRPSVTPPQRTSDS